MRTVDAAATGATGTATTTTASEPSTAGRSRRSREEPIYLQNNPQYVQCRKGNRHQGKIFLRPTIKTKPNATTMDGKPKLSQGVHCSKGSKKESTLVCSACTIPTDPKQRLFCFWKHLEEEHGRK